MTGSPAPAGSITTGVQSSIKQSATNAGVEAKAVEEAAQQDADKKEGELQDGQTLYTKVGFPVFNCLTDNGKPICFAGGRFIVEDSDPRAEAYHEALEYHVSMGTVTKKEG